MGMEQKTHFKVDKSKCISCGKCVNTCSGMVLSLGKEGCPHRGKFKQRGIYGN